MDYSSSIHDHDQSEAAVWGGNDPQRSPQTRPLFGSEPPSSPFRYTAPSNGLHDEGGFGAGDSRDRTYDDSRRPETESTSLHAEEPGPIEPLPEPERQGEQQGPTSKVAQPEPPQPPSPSAPAQQTTPQQAQAPPQPQPTSEPAPMQSPKQQRQPRKAPPPQFKLQAKVTGIERTGRKDPIIRFDVYTNLPAFRTTQYRDVRRLHSEFQKLAEHLISANPEAIVPAVPPAVTSAGAGTEEDELRVKALMQRWFNYVCSNEVLMRDDEMVLFVESDFGYSPMVKKKQPATGVRRKILKQFAPPPDDTPELQEARPIVKLFYLGSLDASHKLDRLVKSRRGLGLTESDFGVKLAQMNVQEPHPGLANAYRKLGKIIQTVGDFHAAQATAEATTLGDPLQYHSSDAFIVKETLTNRQILIREFLQAQDTTRSRLNAADRLKASSSVRREKVDEALAALDEARHAEEALYQKTSRVTQNLVQERRRWFARTSADLRASIREYVLRQIEAERRTLALLESVRPDIRSIDGSGGLSRLGRENHPVAPRRSSLQASQGPKGDAWSGVPRRSDAVLGRASVATLVTAGLGLGGIPEEDGTGDGEDGRRARSLSGVGYGVGIGGPLAGLVAEEDDEDRVDARNAASRLAQSTF